jgi:hypothetical protein
VRLTDLNAPPLLAQSGAALRPVARRVIESFHKPPTDLAERARATLGTPPEVGRVHSAGIWSDVRVHHQISAALDPELVPALRTRLEWYLCRGAFFHTDAHYADVLFGVWCVSGPPAELVFARAGLRVAVAAGTLIVFDPFEVHGVLRAGAAAYRADDYLDAGTSIFVGFEVELSSAVRNRFGMDDFPADARVVSSSTRVSASTGTFE